MNKTGVVFDLDETLIDRQASITAYGRRLHADFRDHIPQPLEPFLERFLELDGNGYVPRETFFQRLAEYVAHSAVSEPAIAAHFAAHAWSPAIPMAGALRLCQRLRAGAVPVGVVTNGGSANQRRKLVTSGLARVVDHVVVSEEVGVRKPEAAIFRIVCERLGIDPSHSWFVGDHPDFDIIGAHRAGFRTIWLKRALPWPEEHAPCYACEAQTLDDVAATVFGFMLRPEPRNSP